MKKIIIVLVFALSFLKLISLTNDEVNVIPLYIGSEKFLVEVADTPEKQRLGLMYRESVPDNFGMLFVHEDEAYRSMWMKNCKISLDLIFLDENKQVINISHNVPPCLNEPCPSYASEQPARYVLELRGKRAEELKLKPGDMVSFIWNH